MLSGNILSLVLLPAVVAGLVSYLSTPVVIRFAQRMGIVDDPSKNKHEKVIHTYPVPRGGGLAIFAGFLVSVVLFLPLDVHIRGILAGAVVVVVMGLLDDVYDLNPYLRIGMGFVAALFPVAAGIGVSFVSNPLGGIIDLSGPKVTFELLGEVRSVWVLSSAFAVFWIVFLMNMVNMGAKGVDGQVTGVVVVAALILAAYSFSYSADIAQWPVTILAAVVAGAYLGFLPWHMYPQKIMPSYSGAALGGYGLAILSMLTTTKVGILFIVLAIPIIDTGYSMLRRVASGKSPVWGDRGHLHHRLLDNGWSKSKVAVFYWGSSAVLGLLALNLNTPYKLYTIVGAVVFVGGLILWLKTRAVKSR